MELYATLLPETGFIQVGGNVTIQALHKSLFTEILILCKLPATLVVFTSVSKETFPGQNEGAGSINNKIYHKASVTLTVWLEPESPLPHTTTSR
jgi:hypothetical protein